ncbi:ECF transporter S component [Mycoplasmatota bacterium zrk1]
MIAKDASRYTIFIFIVFICTYLIRIRIPLPGEGGLIHAGNVALFTIAIVYGKKAGAISGSIGMTLFDLLSGWTNYAIGTLIIRFFCGFVVGVVAHSQNECGKSAYRNILAMCFGVVIIVLGYYIYEIFFIYHGDYIIPILHMPSNISQSIIGIIFAVPIIKFLQKG